jgi:hypothetical protein
MIDHVDHTHGGSVGHKFRRGIHLLTAVVPFLYFHFATSVAAMVRLTGPQLVLAIVFVIVCFEVMRISRGWDIFGQRHYERHRLSAFAWSTIAVGSVLLLAPNPVVASAIIIGCALVDPFLGELRRMAQPFWLVFILGSVMVLLIWYLVGGLSVVSGWWLMLIALMTVLAEKPCWKWIDDNALMQWVPLAIVYLASH